MSQGYLRVEMKKVEASGGNNENDRKIHTYAMNIFYFFPLFLLTFATYQKKAALSLDTRPGHGVWERRLFGSGIRTVRVRTPEGLWKSRTVLMIIRYAIVRVACAVRGATDIKCWIMVGFFELSSTGKIDSRVPETGSESKRQHVWYKCIYILIIQVRAMGNVFDLRNIGQYCDGYFAFFFSSQTLWEFSKIARPTSLRGIWWWWLLETYEWKIRRS